MKLQVKFVLIGVTLVGILLIQIWLRGMKEPSTEENTSQTQQQTTGDQAEIYNPHIPDSEGYVKHPLKTPEEIKEKKKLSLSQNP